MNMMDLLDKGGPVAWVLVGYSVVGLSIVIERFVHFALMGRPPKGFEPVLVDAMKQGKASLLVQEVRGPEATIVRALLRAHTEGTKDLVRVATRVGSQELQRMERGLRTIGILGNTAPLCGLLGTVTGVITSFRVIEQAGGGVDAQVLAGGIWEAMVTTGFGIGAALPLLLLLHVLEGMADRRAQSMRNYASLVIESLPHSVCNEEGSATHHREGVLHAV
jgi:biopolymer transport protein ExbB